ncbi:MAG TPA: DUF2357 domain-containing protein [Actinomycetota bacterium]
MATSSSSEAPLAAPDLERLRRAVLGDGVHPGLATVLPLLQTRHRRELRREERWSKEELVRHPDPRQLRRAMRKPGNLDEHRRPVYTLDERRYATADIRENRFVRKVADGIHADLETLAPTEHEAARLLLQLDEALGRAPYLREVGKLRPREQAMTTTLLQDPLYRAVVAIAAAGG